MNFKALTLIALLFLLPLMAFANPVSINLWHTMEPIKRPLLDKVVREFEQQHPDIKVNLLSKNVEELRTGYQTIAAFTGGGPELVYGPMDNLGAFEVMHPAGSQNSIIYPLEELLEPEFLDKFDTNGKVWYHGHLYQLAERVGNHLALCYNKKLFAQEGLTHAPTTIQELLEYGQKLTKDFDGDGNIDQWGLIWNYKEPFWYVPFFGGYGGKVFDADNNPTLDTDAAVKAFELIRDMRDKYKIMPVEADYNIADNAFKQGRAAMVINGDWSWQDYMQAEKVDFGLARIPFVTQTGLWSSPMVSSTGYSLNTNAKGEKRQAALTLLKYLTGEYVQRRFSESFKSIPSLKSLLADSLLMADPVMQVSALQMQAGQPMPIIPEMRAAWDAMRPALQKMVAGELTPQEAARYQQELTIQKIAEMRKKEKASPWFKYLFWGVAFLLGLAACWVIIVKFIMALTRNSKSEYTRRSRFAVIMAAPAAILLFGTVVYPFIYNIVISFSNMNMTNVNSWELVGFNQYAQVLGEKTFYLIFGKTVIWTVVNVFFHVGIGVFLAVLLNRKLPGKPIFRVLLLLPWAIPQYIVALTWRGMFSADTGAINLILQAIGLTPVNWLGDSFNAFTAATITNIWLGFPFMMVIALGALQSIPAELYEAAEMDGAGPFSKFKKITLPMIRPVMVPAITLGVVWTFNNLNIMWLITNGGEPADSSHILVSYVYRAAFNLYRYGYAAAFSFIIFIVLVVFSLIFMRESQVAEKA